MCIIAIYDTTIQQRPDRETLERMINRNPDGVGCAWNDGENVHFRKGLATASEVLALYAQVESEARCFVFHARIATSGGVSAQKCHPFPITADEVELNITTYDGTRACAFHNGVFRLTPQTGLNDTQTLIKTMLAPLYRRDRYGVEAGKYHALIQYLTRDNRFVILTPTSCYLYGTWEKADDGVRYSNSGYKKPRYTSYKYGGGWGWDGYEYGYQTRYDDRYINHSKSNGGGSYIPTSVRLRSIAEDSKGLDK